MAATRWLTWDRGADLVLYINDAELLDAFRAVIPFASITSMACLVAVTGEAYPPTAVGSRTNVAGGHDATNLRWSFALPYETDLNALTEVRLYATVTWAGRTDVVIDQPAKFVRADGL